MEDISYFYGSIDPFWTSAECLPWVSNAGHPFIFIFVICMQWTPQIQLRVQHQSFGGQHGSLVPFTQLLFQA